VLFVLAEYHSSTLASFCHTKYVISGSLLHTVTPSILLSTIMEGSGRRIQELAHQQIKIVAEAQDRLKLSAE
jgi:hypothetical protein